MTDRIKNDLKVIKQEINKKFPWILVTERYAPEFCPLNRIFYYSTRGFEYKLDHVSKSTNMSIVTRIALEISALNVVCACYNDFSDIDIYDT